MIYENTVTPYIHLIRDNDTGIGASARCGSRCIDADIDTSLDTGTGIGVFLGTNTDIIYREKIALNIHLIEAIDRSTGIGISLGISMSAGIDTSLDKI